ncbi:putative oxidoreductase [Gordonia effusa NBRC 100432]|uniref:Putative oxidoreductase n=1 Tax=Gordonia effusa NBRC 100432 TaxID=1077974 RepID=H0QYV0_9ACTN|nr:geranylgeranyl reductase family protein [Gordonia effusa]GAB18001.1 putative oxidoreductase [Gordonia effusa NBRC 100432]
MTSPAPHATAADVVVVGAGPGGAAAAHYAAKAGRDVLLIDMADFPRDKTCGDGLTPRAVAELRTLGMGDYLARRPRIDGLELNGWGAQQRVHWPAGAFGRHGSAVSRIEFDDAIRRHAADSGASMLLGAKVIDVERDGDRISGIVVDNGTELWTIRLTDLIVADGVRSPLGKILGRQWHRDTAYGVAARAYVKSERAEDNWMGSHLELRSPDGELLPGYGWVFPLGSSSDALGTSDSDDGTGLVNVGVGALATSKRPAQLALKPVLDHYANLVRDEWSLSGAPQRVTSALLPMGGAVSGVAGRNWMLIGDAAACVNPLNGEGIDYALETARLAVELLGAQDYSTTWPTILTDHYSLAFSAARRLAGLLTMPKTVPVLGRPGIRSNALMSMVVRVMGNLITPEDSDLIARAWRTAGRASVRIDPRPPFV